MLVLAACSSSAAHHTVAGTSAVRSTPTSARSTNTATISTSTATGGDIRVFKIPDSYYKTPPARLTDKLASCSIVTPEAVSAAVRPFADFTGTLTPKAEQPHGQTFCYYSAKSGKYVTDDRNLGDDIVYISWQVFSDKKLHTTGQDSIEYAATRPEGTNAAWFDGVAFVFAYPRITISVGISADSSLSNGSASAEPLDTKLVNVVMPAVTRCYLGPC